MAAATLAACSDVVVPESTQYDVVTLESLQLPSPLPSRGEYALLAGQFGSLQSASSLQARVRSSAIPAALIPAVDTAGAQWFVVAAGHFGSPDEARTQRAAISRSLSISAEMPVILLPPQKPNG